VIIVAGGFTRDDSGAISSSQPTPEMLEWGSNSWEDLGNLNLNRYNFAMVQTKRGIMAVGGMYSTGHVGYHTGSVELLNWSTKEWKQVQPSLKKGRSDFGGVVEIPASMFNCTVKDN